MKNTFIAFLESMKPVNPVLIENAISGFNICFESETVPDTEYLLFLKYYPKSNNKEFNELKTKFPHFYEEIMQKVHNKENGIPVIGNDGNEREFLDSMDGTYDSLADDFALYRKFYNDNTTTRQQFNNFVADYPEKHKIRMEKIRRSLHQ